jgi:hypothetical protein
MFARVFPFTLIFGPFIAAAAQSLAPALPPTKVTFKQSDATLSDVAAALAKTSGIAIDVDPQLAKKKCEVAFADTAFWDALEQAAKATDAKLVLLENGRKVQLAPRGQSKVVSAAAGPFRVAAKSVTGRALLDYGVTFHEVQLDVHWEPRYPVFRIDTNPKITKATDDKGNSLLTDPAITRHHPTGALTEMKVRLTGLPREARKIALLEGEFRATAAEKLLTFKFDNPATKTPVTKTEDRVTITLKPLAFDDTTKTWDVNLELEYPAGGPVFESFEEHKWLRDNRLQLVTAGKPTDPESEDVVASGRKVTATYRFKMNPMAKGATLVYQAPGPLVELTVPFKLQNIPVP